MKLAFVVQRFGPDIAGGSEAHCRVLGEQLAANHDITVLTTCARDYVTWRNVLPAGAATHEGMRVLRFPVARERRLKTFADVSDEVFDDTAPVERQRDWFRENGPDAPALLEHLRRHGDEYDLVLFWTFRYAPSFFGVPIVADRAVLLPTAEEDPAIRLGILRDFFRRPAGYLFLTPEEEALVSGRAGCALRPSAIIGTGLDAAPPPPAPSGLERLGVSSPYLLYLGRVDRNKGCETLLAHFLAFSAGDRRVQLVLAGPQTMRVPEHPSIRALGYVTDEIRRALLSNARALVVPSHYESLSIVLLEGWNAGVPALVNAQCAVLKGQVRRANGGLHYRSGAEFAEALRWLLDHEAERAALGRQGLSYVDREYRWPIVRQRVEDLLTAVSIRRTSARAAPDL